jgi:ATP-dependent DNA helicase DinG
LIYLHTAEVYSSTNTLMMSATILDKDMFCQNVGLPSEKVKFIQVGSDFPLQNRPICPLNVVYLNYKQLQQEEIKGAIAKAVDKIMSRHKDHKGIVHTTSYEQLNFIKQGISEENRRQLLETNPDVERDEIPTVLISPSLHLGLNLADDLSRFQIITKVPYPSLSDRWIDEKRKHSERWYNWVTALRLIQSIGRSVRSKEDWAVTYILDAYFRAFVFRNKNIIPPWFSDAIRWG